MNEEAALRVIVSGRVQGVNFRYFTMRHAIELGLTGYVRNIHDRTVEVYAEGRVEHLHKLLDRLNAGPPAAWVDNIVTRWSEHTGHYKGFNIRR